MIKQLFSFLLIAFVSSVSYGQTEQELKDLALAQAQITCDATVSKDYKTVISYTLPAIVDLLGGEVTAVETIQGAMESMNQGGTFIVSSEATALTAFGQENSEYRCIVENKIEIKMPGQTIKSTNYMLGIYNEEARTWHYIEASQLKNPQMKQMVLPDFETALNIPDNTQEVIPD